VRWRRFFHWRGGEVIGESAFELLGVVRGLRLALFAVGDVAEEHVPLSKARVRAKKKVGHIEFTEKCPREGTNRFHQSLKRLLFNLLAKMDGAIKSDI
jgi:hypothetical protein